MALENALTAMSAIGQIRERMQLNIYIYILAAIYVYICPLGNTIIPHPQSIREELESEADLEETHSVVTTEASCDNLVCKLPTSELITGNLSVLQFLVQ